MSPRMESVDPASCTHCPEGMTKAEWGPDENSGIPSPKYKSTHCSHTLKNNTSTCRKHSFLPPALHTYTHEHTRTSPPQGTS